MQSDFSFIVNHVIIVKIENFFLRVIQVTSQFSPRNILFITFLIFQVPLHAFSTLPSLYLHFTEKEERVLNCFLHVATKARQILIHKRRICPLWTSFIQFLMVISNVIYLGKIYHIYVFTQFLTHTLPHIPFLQVFFHSGHVYVQNCVLYQILSYYQKKLNKGTKINQILTKKTHLAQGVGIQHFTLPYHYLSMPLLSFNFKFPLLNTTSNSSLSYSHLLCWS